MPAAPSQVRDRAQNVRETTRPPVPLPSGAAPGADERTPATPAEPSVPASNGDTMAGLRQELAELKERFAGLRTSRSEQLVTAQSEVQQLKARVVQLESELTAAKAGTPPSDPPKTEAPPPPDDTASSAPAEEGTEDATAGTGDGKKELDTAQKAFIASMDKLEPAWRNYNTDAAFLDWLTKNDPTTGLLRQAVMDSHTDRGDAASVVHMLRLFDQSRAAVGEPDASHDTPRIPTEVSTDRTTANADAAPPPPATVEWWKESEIAEMTRRRTAMKGRGKLGTPEGQALNAEYLRMRQAIADQRIIYGQ